MNSNKTKRIRVMFMGLRGLPGVQGGVETHVEKLAPRLANLGCEVEVLTRTPYQPDVATWNGVKVTRLWTPKSRSLEAAVHSVLCALYAGIKRPDILHIHAIGPALATPVARLLGIKVVVTHHGPDYDRQKWGAAGKLALRMGEWLGMRLSNQRIAISPVIQALIEQKHRRGSCLIPNGVDRPGAVQGEDALQRFGLTAQRYILIVSRLVPEKRHIDLIDAFQSATLPQGWKLAIVGGADHPGPYTDKLERLASQHPDVVMTGQQSGVALQQLYANAGLFVLPSSHEGLPIALLEAISHQLPVLASDIPPNRAVGLPESAYFPLGNVARASERIAAICQDLSGARAAAARNSQELMPRYDWQGIAETTLALYRTETDPTEIYRSTQQSTS